MNAPVQKVELGSHGPQRAGVSAQARRALHVRAATHLIRQAIANVEMVGWGGGRVR